MIARESLFLACLSLLFAQSDSALGQTDRLSKLGAAIGALSPDVLSDEQRELFKNQTWRSLRASGDVANRRDGLCGFAQADSAFVHAR